MTPPTSSSYPTLSKDNEPHANQLVFKNFTIRADTPKQAPTTPHSANLPPTNYHTETPQTSKETNSLPPTPAKDHTTSKIDNNPRTIGKPPTDLMLFC